MFWMVKGQLFNAGLFSNKQNVFLINTDNKDFKLEILTMIDELMAMPQVNNKKEQRVERVQIGNDHYFKISNSDQLRPFFMSIVSDSDHWMFIASNGGLTAGRKNAKYALFPYYTDDKITESASITGSCSIFHVQNDQGTYIWEPFSDRFEGIHKITRNLYKGIYGNRILFEEINHDLELTFRYEWSSTDKYGFVRESKLVNNGKEKVFISLMDGLQNVLPYGVGSNLQNRQSNLVDAYKRSELVKEIGLGIYALSAIIVDKAEPSEALKANTIWSKGFENPTYLLSSRQLKSFRQKQEVYQEIDVKAEKGAYLIHTKIVLDAGATKEWLMVADVNQSHAKIAEISYQIKHDDLLISKVKEDVDLGTHQLIQLVAASDGLQRTADNLNDSRHFSNTMFNIMRGGIFDNNYDIEKWDFIKYISKANTEIFETSKRLVQELPRVFSLSTLNELAGQSGDLDFKRLCLEYMPLKFSRRHGDPSRPWNKFSINIKNDIDGSKVLDYEGNWRDIFQNWETLVHSYPEFIDSMIAKFLNASTFDGYNPYRVTKDGFDWEIIEPDDPWSYIGYWGDHQIIYLLKFLEFMQNHSPGKMEAYFTKEQFVYANVPYRIKNYQDILKNPKDTIEFDRKLDRQIRSRRDALGADGALMQQGNGDIHRVNFIEKILATVLCKLSNFIPEGGIWMNTQRPEWNDANNALVGNGVSMVTLYYLRRFLNFFKEVLNDAEPQEISLSHELADFFEGIWKTLEDQGHDLSNQIDNSTRKQIMDDLGYSGSAYREKIYNNTFSGEKRRISLDDLKQFISIGLRHLEHSIKVNRRNDGLYHAYNLMTVESDTEVSIAHLSEMLEGQVAVLSSGYLSSGEALEVLDALKKSKLFREDQYSYLLYPNKELPLFSEKNILPKEAVLGNELLSQLIADGNTTVIEKDCVGEYHFNGSFNNAKDLEAALDSLSQTKYGNFLAPNKVEILQIFERVFNHSSFTGRSGTFYGYEGLGSIYWHMVSKLLLAVKENCLKAIEDGEGDDIIGRLLEHFYEINEGLGVHKPPSLYGAFPTDPYSHTPFGKGAQQPGMTGQVKEDILTRFGELGVFVKDGKLHFSPKLLRENQFVTSATSFDFVDIEGASRQLLLEVGSLGFTYCQIPVVYKVAPEESINVNLKNGDKLDFKTANLDLATSKMIFERTGEVDFIVVNINKINLK